MNLSSYYNRKKIAVLQCLFIAVLLFPTLAQAQNSDKRWYHIEVIIYKQWLKNSDFWDADIELSWPQGLKSFKATEQIAEAQNKLSTEVNAIADDPSRKVLWHRSWHQELQVFQDTNWLFVRGGQENRQRFELEGAIKVSRSRYLHLYLDLWLNEFTSFEQHNSNLKPLPELPDFTWQLDCPKYQHMPLWLRDQLYHLDFTKVYLEKLAPLWQQSLSHTLVNPISHRLKLLSENWPLQPPPKLSSRCDMSFEGNEVIDPYYQESENSTNLLLNEYSPFAQQQIEYEPLILNAREKMQALIQQRTHNYSLSADLPLSLLTLVDINQRNIQKNAFLALKNIYPFQKQQKVLLNRLYYIDHPKVGLLVRITRPDLKK